MSANPEPFIVTAASVAGHARSTPAEWQRLVDELALLQIQVEDWRLVLARIATSNCCGTAHGSAAAALDLWPSDD